MKIPEQGLPVLVVDDDPEGLRAACEALGPRFPVLTAASGLDALRVARGTRLRAVVLDVMLSGGMDGFAVFGELQRDPATRRVPVIFLTGVNRATGLPFGAGALGRYLGAEPAAFLEKPVSAAALLAEMEKILGGAPRA